MKESAIEMRVNRAARAADWLVYKFVSPSQRGVPDRMYLRDGEMFFIEFNAPGKHLTKLQQVRRKQIQMAGFKVYVIDDVLAGELLFASMERSKC